MRNTEFRHHSDFRHDILRRRRRNAALIFVAVSVGLLFFVRSGIQWAGTSLGGVLIQPIWIARQTVSTWWTDWSIFFASKKTLNDENIQLREELRLFAEQRLSDAYIRREYAALKAMYGKEEATQFALASILAKPPVSPFDTFVIDLGGRDGIVPGMRVYSSPDVAIGEISLVYNFSAVVELFSSQGYEFQGFVGSSSTPITVVGVGGGSFRASVPKGFSVNEGDILRYPSERPDVLGVLRSISVPSNSSFSTLFFSLPTNYLELQSVYVEIPEK